MAEVSRRACFPGGSPLAKAPEVAASVIHADGISANTVVANTIYVRVTVSVTATGPAR